MHNQNSAHPSPPLYYLTGRFVLTEAHCANSVRILSHTTGQIYHTRKLFIYLQEKIKYIPFLKKVVKLGNVWMCWSNF